MSEMPSSEESIKSELGDILHKHSSRKAFIAAAAGFGGIVVSAPILRVLTKEVLPPESRDTLSKKELLDNHIEIFQTEHSQLLLRSGVFEMPLFREVKEGKLDGVVITLVDNEIVPFNGDGVGDSGARTVWQTGSDLYLEGYVEKSRYVLARGVAKTRESVEFWQKRTEEANNADERSAFQIRLNEAIKTQQEAEHTYNDLGSEDWKRTNGPAGAFTTTKAIIAKDPWFAKDNPNIKNKAYIFIAVGGISKPQKKHSMPNPYEIPPAIQSGYLFLADRAGFVLRHEVFHYNSDNQAKAHTEARADLAAFDSLVDAWDKHKQGDSSGYHFVFKTDEGYIITKTPKTSEQTGNKI